MQVDEPVTGQNNGGFQLDQDERSMIENFDLDKLNSPDLNIEKENQNDYKSCLIPNSNYNNQFCIENYKRQTEQRRILKRNFVVSSIIINQKRLREIQNKDKRFRFNMVSGKDSQVVNYEVEKQDTDCDKKKRQKRVKFDTMVKVYKVENWKELNYELSMEKESGYFCSRCQIY